MKKDSERGILLQTKGVEGMKICVARELPNYSFKFAATLIGTERRKHLDGSNVVNERNHHI